MSVDMESIIDIGDPVYRFNEVMCHMDLNEHPGDYHPGVAM